MIKREKCEKKRKNLFYNQKKKRKKLYFLNFSPLLKNFIFLTLCLIINFFKINNGFLIKIKNFVNILLSYSNMIKIIIEIETN